VTHAGTMPRRPPTLRVIAGRWRRRRLSSLPGVETRPMLDRMRETLFNVLRPELEGCTFADLYAGTGAVGIEALSRGAARAIFVEQSPAAVDVIRENLRAVGAGTEARVVRSTVAAALPGLDADVVFLGPPYAAADEYARTLAALGAAPPPLVVAQHARADRLAERYGGLQRRRTIEMGSNALSFYRPAAVGTDGERGS
jgi:16S rRNA (guanine966-N2)-methyltransferase